MSVRLNGSPCVQYSLAYNCHSPGNSYISIPKLLYIYLFIYAVVLSLVNASSRTFSKRWVSGSWVYIVQGKDKLRCISESMVCTDYSQKKIAHVFNLDQRYLRLAFPVYQIRRRRRREESGEFKVRPYWITGHEAWLNKGGHVYDTYITNLLTHHTHIQHCKTGQRGHGQHYI